MVPVLISGTRQCVYLMPLLKKHTVETANRMERNTCWKKAFNETGEWLPQATVDAIDEHTVAIKGPLTTPIGGGIRSLNVALRQKLDLYTCLRPVRWFTGVPSPVVHPEQLTWSSSVRIPRISTQVSKPKLVLIRPRPARFLEEEFPEDFAKVRFGTDEKVNEYLGQLGGGASGQVEVGLGIKPVSRHGTERLVRSAIEYAIQHGRKSVTLVHEGNIMKFTEVFPRLWLRVGRA